MKSVAKRTRGVRAKAGPLSRDPVKAAEAVLKRAGNSVALAVVDALRRKAKGPNKAVIVDFLDKAYDEIKAGGGQGGGDILTDGPPNPGP